MNPFEEENARENLTRISYIDRDGDTWYPYLKDDEYVIFEYSSSLILKRDVEASFGPLHIVRD